MNPDILVICLTAFCCVCVACTAWVHRGRD